MLSFGVTDYHLETYFPIRAGTFWNFKHVNKFSVEYFYKQ